MHLPPSPTAEERDRLRSYMRLLETAPLPPPQAAVPRTMPPSISTSEPIHPFYRPPFPSAISPSLNIASTFPSAISPSPPPLPSVGVPTYPSFPPPPAPTTYPARTINPGTAYAASPSFPSPPAPMAPFPSIADGSISLPGSFAPGLNSQVRDMHRQFAITVADDDSIATAASAYQSPSTVPSSIGAVSASIGAVSASIASPDTSPFLTDEDLATSSFFRRDLSPIRIASGSMQIQGSYCGFTSYALRFESSPQVSGPVQLGLPFQDRMRLDLQDDPQVLSSPHRHRFVIICKMGGKFVGLDICPSRSTSVQVFPLLLTLRSRSRDIIGFLAHPFLRGSVSFDPTTKSSHQDRYFASPGWGQGGGIVSSYAAALTLVDGYKRLTGRTPGQITGLRSDNSDCSIASSQCRANPTITAPRISSYILAQFAHLGCHTFASWDRLSLETAAHPATPCSLADPRLTVWGVPTSDRPSATVPPPPFSPQIWDSGLEPLQVPTVSGIPTLTGVPSLSEISPQARPPIFPVGSAVSVAGSAGPKHSSDLSSDGFIPVDPTHSQLNQEKKSRQSLIDRVAAAGNSSKKLHAMPMAGSSTFQTFRMNLELDLRGSAWFPRGICILDYSTTDQTDSIVKAVSADLATLLVYCARATNEECRGQLMGGDGSNLLKRELGCELWRRVIQIFQPDGIRATWDNHDLYSRVTHRNKEPIETLANRIVESANLLADGSSGLIPANTFSNKLKLAQCVCMGPYHTVFKSVLEDITVTQKDEWDISAPSFTFEKLVTRLGSHLRRSTYQTASGLKAGQLMSQSSARRSVEVFDKWGKTERSGRDALFWLSRYWKFDGTIKGCPICAQHRLHPFTACPSLISRGFTVSYNASKDTNPDIGSGYTKPGHSGATAAATAAVAARKASADLQSQITQVVLLVVVVLVVNCVLDLLNNNHLTLFQL